MKVNFRITWRNKRLTCKIYIRETKHFLTYFLPYSIKETYTQQAIVGWKTFLRQSFGMQMDCFIAILKNVSYRLLCPYVRPFVSDKANIRVFFLVFFRVPSIIGFLQILDNVISIGVAIVILGSKIPEFFIAEHQIEFY